MSVRSTDSFTKEIAVKTAVRPFEVLFLTNFSDACFGTIPALARLSDEVNMRLTLLHAYGRGTEVRPLERNLQNFFPEADDYASCKRVLVPGTPYEAVRRIRAEQPVDLVVAPAGDPLGFPRFGHSSLRSRLVREVGAPMWTSGNGLRGRRLARQTRHVACCLGLGRSGRGHLRLAAQYAQSVGATLHVIHVVPSIDEGTWVALAQAEPFDREHALEAVRRVAPTVAVTPDVHVTDRGQVPQVLDGCDADVVFLDGDEWMNRWWFTSRINSVVDGLPCPAVCVKADRDDLTWQVPPRQARYARRRAVEMPQEQEVEPAFDFAERVGEYALSASGPNANGVSAVFDRR
jgi:nucleotide-binding universal stress UspA family protein